MSITDVSNIQNTIEYRDPTESVVKIGSDIEGSKDNLNVPNPNDPASVGKWGAYLNDNTFEEIMGSFDELKDFLDSTDPILGELITRANKNNWSIINNNIKGYGVKFGYSDLTTTDSTRVFIHGYDSTGLPVAENGFFYTGSDDVRDPLPGDEYDNVIANRVELHSTSLGPIAEKFDNKVGMLIAEKGTDGIYYPYLVSVYRDDIQDVNTKVYVNKWDKTTETLVADPVGVSTGIKYPEHSIDHLTWYHAAEFDPPVGSGLTAKAAGDEFVYLSETPITKSVTKKKWNSVSEVEEDVVDPAFAHNNTIVKDAIVLGIFDTRDVSGSTSFYYYNVNTLFDDLIIPILQFEDEKSSFERDVDNFKERYSTFKKVQTEERAREYQDNLTRANIEQTIREYLVKQKEESGDTEIVVEYFNNNSTTPDTGWDVNTSGTSYPETLAERKRLISGLVNTGGTELESVTVHGARSSKVLTLGQDINKAVTASTLQTGLTIDGSLKLNTTLEVDGAVVINNGMSIPAHTFTALNITATSQLTTENLTVNGTTETRGITNLAAAGVLTTARGGLKANQTLVVDGETTLNGAVEINENINIVGASTTLTVDNEVVTNNLTVNTNASVSGATSLNTLDVSAGATMSNITSDGTVLLSNSAAEHTVTGKMTVNEVEVNNATTMNAKATITNGGLEVTGTGTFNDHLEVNAGMNVDGTTTTDTINNSGNISTSTLNTSGTATIQDLNVTTNIDSATATIGVMTVTGSSQLDGNITANGDMELTTGDLDITSGSITAGEDISGRWLYQRELGGGTNRKLLADLFMAKWSGSNGYNDVTTPRGSSLLLKGTPKNQVGPYNLPNGFEDIVFDGTDLFTGTDLRFHSNMDSRTIQIRDDSAELTYNLGSTFNDDFTVYFSFQERDLGDLSGKLFSLQNGSNWISFIFLADYKLRVSTSSGDLTDVLTAWESGGVKDPGEVFRDINKFKSLSFNFLPDNTGYKLIVVNGSEKVAEYDYGSVQATGFNELTIGQDANNFLCDIFSVNVAPFTGSEWEDGVGDVNRIYNAEVEVTYGNFHTDYMTDYTDYALARVNTLATESAYSENAGKLDGKDSAEFGILNEMATWSAQQIFDAGIKLNAEDKVTFNNDGSYIQSTGTASMRVIAAGHLFLDAGTDMIMTGGNFTYNGHEIWHAGNDGGGSGLNADLINNLSSSQLVRNDVSTTMTDNLVFSNANGIHLNGSPSYKLSHDGSVVLLTGTGGMKIHADSNNNQTIPLDLSAGTNSLQIASGNGSQTSNAMTYNGNKVWHAGNDGSGSGLDADMIDGLGSSSFVRSDTSDTLNGDYTINGTLKVSDSVALQIGEGLEFRSDDDYFGTNLDARIFRQLDANGTSGSVDGGFIFESFTPTDNTAVELLRIRNNEFKYKGSTIWHSGNDGATSGLSAQYLGGQDINYYRNASNLNAGIISDSLLPSSITSNITGNAATSSKWATARTITLSGAVTGSTSIDGSGNVSLATTATSDPTLTLAGDATGSATFTNLGNATLTVAVTNDSHTHDGRYRTESELSSTTSTSGAKLIGTYDEFGTSNSTNVQDVLDDLDAYAVSTRTTVNNITGGSTTVPKATNANTLGGASPSDAASNSTIVKRTSSGYINANYFNTSAGATSTAPSNYFVETGSDGYIRKMSASNMRNNLGITKSYIDTLNVDADTLDGINSSSFIRSDANDIKTSGYLRFNDFADLYMGTGSDVRWHCNGSHLYTDLNSGIGNWYVRDGSTTRFTFDDAGHFTATGNITAYSDRRLKDNIQEVDVRERVSNIKLYEYDRNDMDKHETGVIAQDVQEHFPEFVYEAKEDNEQGFKTLSVDYAKLSTTISLDAQKRIDDLESEVAELKEMVKLLLNK